jgi:hypothetical protein
LDPGGTTGWCLVVNGELQDLGQVFGDVVILHDLITETQPDVVVAESFRLYPGMAQKLRWSNLPVPVLLGGIELSCRLRCIPFVLQTPRAAKQKFPDATLKELGWYRRKGKHSRDATRHALLYIGKMA